MKTLTTLFIVLMSVLLVHAGDNDTESKAGRAFAKMKTLEGVWEAAGEDGASKRVTYEIYANGTALHETFEFVGKKHETMITLYYLDGDNLMLTHYCMANNQPTMRAAAISDDVSEITFNFVNASNLPDPNAGHMYKAVFEFNDDGTYANAWTFRKDGKEVFTEADVYDRVK